MATNNIDKNIKDKFVNRTFTPSSSAWERLSMQLDEQPQKRKRNWFFYVSIAASILLFFSLGYTYFTSSSNEAPTKDIIVENPIDKQTIDAKIEKLVNEIPVEEAIVKNKVEEIDKPKLKTDKKLSIASTIEVAKTNKKSTSIKKQKNTNNTITKEINNSIKEEIIITSVPVKNKQQDLKTTIKVNADDLLYAVTHSKKEVKAYYAKYNVNREDVLKTIKNELKKSNIKVNPQTILAEVERSIDDEDFQNNFMRSLKSKISTIATAIASRND